MKKQINQNRLFIPLYLKERVVETSKKSYEFEKNQVDTKENKGLYNLEKKEDYIFKLTNHIISPSKISVPMNDVLKILDNIEKPQEKVKDEIQKYSIVLRMSPFDKKQTPDNGYLGGIDVMTGEKATDYSFD
ncbi:MAG: hypothetical protein JW700_02480 [Candidatus Aenigmarchaeota archaeon]|nr:hypothetical protein [Candidatus Aenigmarchaeota archaeon]